MVSYLFILSIAGFLITLLIMIIGYFIKRQLNGQDKVNEQIMGSLDKLNELMAARIQQEAINQEEIMAINQRCEIRHKEAV